MKKGYGETLLKRCLKRKVKITLGMVVAFLISGTIGFADDVIGNENPNKDYGNFNGSEVKYDHNGDILMIEKNNSFDLKYLDENAWLTKWEQKYESARGYTDDEIVFNRNLYYKGTGFKFVSNSDEVGAIRLNFAVFPGDKKFVYDSYFTYINQQINNSDKSLTPFYITANGNFKNNGTINYMFDDTVKLSEKKASTLLYSNSKLYEFTNNGYLKGKGRVYGMGTNSFADKLKNNGTINLDAYDESAGIGIVPGAGYLNDAKNKTIENLYNNGVISGKVSQTNIEDTTKPTTFQSALSGIRVKIGENKDTKVELKSEIKNLTNNGLIDLYSEDKQGYVRGIDVNSAEYINKLTNNGKVAVKQTYFKSNGKDADIRPAGVFLRYISSDNNFYNNGLVERTFAGAKKDSTEVEGYAAIEFKSGEMQELINKGTSLSTTISTGESEIVSLQSHGIKVDGEIAKELRNDGKISGISESKDNNPSGIGSGIGIYGEISKLSNNGVVLGSDYAVYIRGKDLQDGENLGLMITKGQEIIGKRDNTETVNITNHGLYIKVDENGKYTVTDEKNQTITSANQKVDNTNNVINGKIENGQVESIDLADSQIDLANKGYVFNGFDKTLNITEKDLKIKDSVVNGYETAVYLDGGKAEFKNTIINGGLDTEHNEKGDVVSETGAIIGADGKDNTLVLVNSTVNGKIDFGTGNDTLELKRDETSNTAGFNYLNKDVSLGAGNDNMTISSNTYINGNIDGEEGKDTLNLGDISTAEADKEKYAMDIESNVIRVFGEIKNFEDIKVTGQVHLYETAKISADNKDGKIYINNDSSLNLRIDPTVNENGKITGHALYNSGYTVSGAGTVQEGEYEGKTSAGTLNFVTNGIGHGGVIGMGNTILDDNLNIRTDSLIHSAVKDGTDIKIEVVDELEDLGYQDSVTVRPTPDPDVDPDNPGDTDKPIKNERRYPQLNRIYKSIIASGNQNINAINPTVTAKPDESDYDTDVSTDARKYQLGNLLTLLNDIYANNPYAFSHDLSKESMKMFSDTVLNSPFRPFEKQWLVYGGLTHENSETKDTYYGKHLHEFDLKSMKNDVEIESKIYGAYARAEYGNSEEVSTGIILGGNKSNSDFGNGASLDGNAVYLGGYIKKEKDNWRVIGGIGTQYSEYDSKRIAENMVQHFSYDEDYSDYGFNAYLGAKYDFKLNEEYSLEPNIKLEYSYIKQESISEKPQDLAIDVDSEKFQSLDGKVGVDLKKVKFDEDKKSTFRVGVSYNYNFDGDEDQYLTGRMKGGTDFDILSPNKENNRVSFNVGYEVEKESGWIYDIRGSYGLTAKGHNGVRTDSDTRNQRDSWNIGIGFGFKFNDIEDFTFAAANLFDFDKFVIKPEGKEIIENASQIINKRKLKGTLLIEGHTDWTGTDEYNQVLSEKRARAVKEEFKANVKNENIKYETKGYGEKRPVATNRTKEGRAKNRRVDIKYIKD